MIVLTRSMNVIKKRQLKNKRQNEVDEFERERELEVRLYMCVYEDINVCFLSFILLLVVSVLQYLFFLLYTRSGQYSQGCSHPHSHDYRNYRCSLH